MKALIRFWSHRYSPGDFSPGYVRENLVMLMRGSPGALDATREGRLFVRGRWVFRLLNVLTLGARQARVRRVVEYTFITLMIEIYHPFDQEILKTYARRKQAFALRLLDRLREINGRVFPQEHLRAHVEMFMRASLLQGRIIAKMQCAIARQREPALVAEVKRAMKRGVAPRLVIRGSSGAYWMRGEDREIVGIFKPFDEEAFTPNNPIGPSRQGALGQRTMRFGVRQGEMAHREVAAFVVDSFFEFGIVPRTDYAAFSHGVFYHHAEDPYATPRRVKTKRGSFQEYLPGFTSLDALPKEAWGEVPLDEFQLLVVLDVILGNSDRNMGNILVAEGKLAAIDHGLTLPDCHEEVTSWYWGAFPQGEQPFVPSIVELLMQFPYAELAHRLAGRCQIELSAMARMRERVGLLAVAAKQGWTPKQLEGLFTVETLDQLKDLDQTLPEKAVEILIPFAEKTSLNAP